MIVLVCGGRFYEHRDRVYSVLDQIHAKLPITLVVHGAARGADAFADEWAADRKVARDPHKADWMTHGKAAGPIRNQKMLQRKPDLVVAFPGGRGTADMVRRAKAVNICVLEVP